MALPSAGKATERLSLSMLPIASCDFTVMTALMAASTSSGSFSMTKLRKASLRKRSIGAGFCSGSFRWKHAAQRPVVPQQQNEGQRDDLRLGHQSQGEQGHH